MNLFLWKLNLFYRFQRPLTWGIYKAQVGKERSHPFQGPLFRHSQSNAPWIRNASGERARRCGCRAAKKDLGILVSHAARHVPVAGRKAALAVGDDALMSA